MRGKDLLECMEYIDDALIEEALEPAVEHISYEHFTHKHKTAARWGMAAACVIVVGISTTALWSHQHVGEERFGSGTEEGKAIAMDTGGTEDLVMGAQADRTASENALTAGKDSALSAGGNEDDSDSRAAGAESRKTGNAESLSDGVSENENQQRDLLSDKEASEEVSEEASRKNSYVIISDYYGEKDDAVDCFAAPQRGTFFRYHYLDETVRSYTMQENTIEITDSPIYAYEVVIDVYGDDGTDAIDPYRQLNGTGHGRELLEQEYRRLLGLGYAVSLSEEYVLTGVFTMTEMDTFQASPEYGYAFRFESEN